MEYKSLLYKYVDVVRSLDLDDIEMNHHLPSSLVVSEDGRLQSYNAPFDWTNRQARLVLVGITPGFSQSIVALRMAHRNC